MRSKKEIRCHKDGRLLFKIIDDEYIEISCPKCGLIQTYKLPKRQLTDYTPSGKIVLK